MILRTKTRRRGGALVEVLIGFGILGIAATSIITLFPFAALTVGRALQDDRTTTCAVIADGQLRDVHTHNVVEAGNSSTEPCFVAMDTPGTGALPTPNPDEPSYPVFVDPMGFAGGKFVVGDNGQTQIPRVTLSFINSDLLALRYCSLMDSLTFDEDGTVPGGVDMREMRYNYAWMLQRPVDRDRFTVRMQVVVYNKRTFKYSPPGTEAEFTGVTFNPGQTSVIVPATADVRKGNWVLEAGNLSGGVRQAEFYRILSVTDQGANVVLELHKPISRIDGSMAQYSGTLVVMPGVADVFERPYLTGTLGP